MTSARSSARNQPKDVPGTDRIRLQKILAQAGLASRRKAEDMIRAGRVRVDGRVITSMGFRVDPGSARITLDDQPVRRVVNRIYLLLYKPPGYVTTLDDPQGRPTVIDLIPDVPDRVFPVGRLDLDSEGALLLTNDGRLANFVLHPRYQVNKTYEATVRGRPGRHRLHRLEGGIVLEGKKTWPAHIRILACHGNGTTLEIIIHEGRKRQVRKMFKAIGHPVIRLRRMAYGRLRLGGLKPGKYRFLTKKDLKNIFSGKIPFTISDIAD